MKKKITLQKPEYDITDQMIKITAYSKKGKSVTAIFDKDDLNTVQAIESWYAQWDKDFNCYLIQSKTSKIVNGQVKAQKTTLSATILGVSPNAPIHHINGDLLDNRKSNLEIFDRTKPNDYLELEDGTVAIQLKNRYGYVVAKTLISKNDLQPLINTEYVWILQKKANGQPYVSTHAKSDRIYLDQYLTKCPEGFYVHHINKNPLDNRRENLEIKELETDKTKSSTSE